MSDTARPSPTRSGDPSGGVASQVLAGTFSVESVDGDFAGWHSHELHQLVYALEGVAEVEAETARYLLPPQQALWVPAGVGHSSTLVNVKAVSVFFDPAMGLAAGDRVRILAAAPVIREMIRYAQRWPISRRSSDARADAFFEVLAQLVVEWLNHETPLCLPTARDPLVGAAMAYTNDHLGDVALHDVCAAVGASDRSLRRAFLAATGMSWRRYLQESRLLKAMALLADEGPSIVTIALAVGFESQSSFNRAFRQYTGETPQAYRKRVCAASAQSVLESFADDDPCRNPPKWTRVDGASTGPRTA